MRKRKTKRQRGGVGGVEMCILVNGRMEGAERAEWIKEQTVDQRTKKNRK